MIHFLKKLFSNKPEVDMDTLIANNALIIDVRSKSEFASGHFKGSVNIPLDTLQSQVSKFSKEKAIITCCASGMRSETARSILKSNGFTEVYNAGGWQNLLKYKK